MPRHKRRRPFWINVGPSTLTLAANATNTIQLLSESQCDEIVGGTIAATRIACVVYADAAMAVGDLLVVELGVSLHHSGHAPSPDAEPEEKWMWMENIFLGFESSFDRGHNVWRAFDINVRSKRVLDHKEYEMSLSAHNAFLTGANVQINLALKGRILVLGA